MEPAQSSTRYPIHKIRPLTPQEEEGGLQLYRQHWNDFIEQIWILRHALDEIWETGFSTRLADFDLRLLSTYVEEEKSKSLQKQPFPKGYCFHITHIFDKYLNQKIGSQELWIKHLEAYLKKGGFFRKVWGIDKESYFQTALQIGPIILDISYNTVTLTKPKVDWQLLGPDCVFREVRDWEDYLTIKSSYHQTEIYSNTVFPTIQHDFPVIYFDKTEGKYLLPMEKIFGILWRTTKQSIHPAPIVKALDEQQSEYLSKIHHKIQLINPPRIMQAGMIQKILLETH